MAYFPNKTKVKQELQENVTKTDLSCVHLTTAQFFEPNIAYVRDNTTKEKWTSNDGVFARPVPIQLPVMGQATLKLKTYFIPYRVLSEQWYDFYNRTPHVPANSNFPILVQEMPYFKMDTLQTLFKTTDYATPAGTGVWDFQDSNANKYKLTSFGRHCMKILNQLRYKILWGNVKSQKHYNALRILAFAKAYLDFYYSSQYAFLTASSYEVEQLFKKDSATAYELTFQDFDNIFKLTRYTWYEEDYFVSQWDNPTSPNIVSTSFGNISLPDITFIGDDVITGEVTNLSAQDFNTGKTPYLKPASDANDDKNHYITQYALDSLKRCTDMVRRYAIAGSRSIDRYLARFGVLLTAEKLKRSEFYGEQQTQMQFGAVMSTAETAGAAVGDYAGQGIINSDGQQHNQFELDEMKDLGCIMQIFTITPKVGYFQGIARENLRSDPESYFNGQFDALGTQATSAAEIYVSNDGTSPFSDEDQVDRIFGYISRQAHMKLALDNLTGDFVVPSMNNGTLFSPWHMFRVFDDNYWNSTVQGSVVHSPFFAQAYDADQYNRIFNSTSEETGDKLVVLLQMKIEANIHAKPVYDTYDFEGEGKEIVLDGLGPKQN